ncbi:MAG: PilZ domain-containing protein [Bradyrhizobiaceae bacterium]|nr:MAG: PilZ domain-containing protein [Bradyrhizobiaceae bacterium]
MDDKRTTQRHRVFKAGTIEFGGGAFDCTVRNLSATGAALDVASPFGIPKDMTLVVPSEQRRHHCRVVWRKEKRIGVAFDD